MPVDLRYSTEIFPVNGQHIRRMGMGIYLWLFLRARQTDREGTVFGGKPLTFEWIAERIPNCPPATTLQLWMAALRLGGYVRVTDSAVGMNIRVIDPYHWPSERQLRAEKLVSIDEIKLLQERL